MVFIAEEKNPIAAWIFLREEENTQSHLLSWITPA
jgi:hypothetical protein